MATRQTSNAEARRDGDALVFTGALTRDAVAGLWKRVGRIGDVRRFDLRAVERIDSAGLAVLAEWAAQAGGAVAIDGEPPGLAELRAAYRLTPTLAFASA